MNLTYERDPLSVCPFHLSRVKGLGNAVRASARTGRLVTSATLNLGLAFTQRTGVEHRARKPLISSAAIVNAAARARLELEVAGRARHGAGGGVDGEGEPEAGLVLE